jgi:hypothetical protein
VDGLQAHLNELAQALTDTFRALAGIFDRLSRLLNRCAYEAAVAFGRVSIGAPAYGPQYRRLVQQQQLYTQSSWGIPQGRSLYYPPPQVRRWQAISVWGYMPDDRCDMPVEVAAGKPWQGYEPS